MPNFKVLKELLGNPQIPKFYLFSKLFRERFWYRIIGLFKTRRFGTFCIHPSAKVRCTSKIYQLGKGIIRIGYDCNIDALSENGIVCKGNVNLGEHTYITCTSDMQALGKGIVIGNKSSLGTHGFYGCAGGIEIGENVLIGNFVSMHSENHNFERLDVPIDKQGVSHKGIKIGNDCWLGAKVTILDGVTIGDGCVIAAGAVVTSNIPDFSIAAGVPAKIIKKRKE